MYKSQRRLVAFTILSSALILVGWHSLVDTFTLSLRNDEYTHILLILPVSAALIYFDGLFLNNFVDWDLRIAPALVAIAAAIALNVRFGFAQLTADQQLSLRMFALVVAWIGIFVLCFGLRPSRSALFPLLFLLGLVPLPRNALNFTIAVLQQGSAWSAHALFSACAVPVFQQGVLVTVPGLTIKVAQECSSIRSSSMLLVTAMVLAQVLLRSPWRKAVIIGLAIPLSVAKNGLRIFTIAMLGTRVDPGYLTGRLHHQGGIVFFAVALAGIFTLIWIFRRSEDVLQRPALNPMEVKSPGA